MQRNIRTLEDAAAAIHDLQDEIDKITTNHWDRHRLRVVNAAFGIDDYDYVVLKQLKDLIGGGKKAETVEGVGDVTNITGDFRREGVFGVGINRNLIVQVDAAPHFIAGGNGILKKIYVDCKFPSSGASIILDIHELLGASILDATKIEIPAGAVQPIAYPITTFSNNVFTEGAKYRCDVDQIGSSVPGGTVVVKMLYELS